MATRTKPLHKPRQIKLSSPSNPASSDTSETRAKAILDALQSGDKARRTAAITELARSDARTFELVEDAVEAAEAAYEGLQDEMSDWRALESEPFYNDDGKAI